MAAHLTWTMQHHKFWKMFKLKHACLSQSVFQTKKRKKSQREDLVMRQQKIKCYSMMQSTNDSDQHQIAKKVKKEGDNTMLKYINFLTLILTEDSQSKNVTLLHIDGFIRRSGQEMGWTAMGHSRLSKNSTGESRKEQEWNTDAHRIACQNPAEIDPLTL